MGRRAQSDDYLHGFKFRAKAMLDDNSDMFASAGFNTITTPETTVETTEYREGMFAFTRKEPGVATQGDVTFSRGVVLGNTVFWDWLKRVMFGGDYRAEITYYQYHRTAMKGAAVPPEVPDFQGGPYADDSLATTADKSLKYKLHEAFPIRVKVAGDLDATASDISLQEMDVAYEYWDYDNG